MNIRQRQFARIARRFKIVDEIIAIGELRFSFVRVANPDSVLDQVAERGGTALPYWAELWESSIAMAEFIQKSEEHQRSEVREQRSEKAGGSSSLTSDLWPLTSVLDLGCGMGLAGVVAAKLGAKVLLADIETEALLFARLNSIDMHDRVRVRKVDWQRDDLREKFDLILGADVVYERAQWQHLEKFWRKHLAENGQVILGEPGRQTGEEFVEWIRAKGWSLQIEKRKAREKMINIIQIRNSKSEIRKNLE